MAVKYLLDFPDFDVVSKHKLQKRVLFIGSCFAQNIGTTFERLGFDYITNPFGVVYNPISISEQIDLICKNKTVSESDFFNHDGLWNYWNSSHKFSEASLNSLKSKINNQIDLVHSSLSDTDWVVITLGTSFVFRLSQNQKIVANCHKAPAKWFEKKFLDSDEISDAVKSISQNLKSINPEINILWTISPVRYIRDGLTESIFSKSLLFQAIQKHINNPNNFYFPAYEILTDCLRDYRFYAEDLVHPSEQSIQIISDFLIENWLDVPDLDLFEKIKSLENKRRHIPINSNQSKESNTNLLEDTIKRKVNFWSLRNK